MLKNKRILFIGPIFYNYHDLIIKKLEEKGATVYFIPERKYGLEFTIVNNFLKKKLQAFQYAHYFSFINKIENQSFDYLFVVRGFKIPLAFIDKIKALNPQIKTIMYQWDSSTNNDFLHLVDHFDVVNSFDYSDCEKNKKLHYIPLFYSDDIKKIESSNTTKQYDIFLFGVYMPTRYQAATQIKKYCEEHQLSYYFYLYIPLRTYIKEIIVGKKLDKSFLFTKPLSRPNYIQILHQSSVVVDISSPTQSGLAMRIIESLACDKKILTTNTRLLQDHTINSNQVRFLNVENIQIPHDFIHSQVDIKNESILSLGNWIDKNFENIT